MQSSNVRRLLEGLPKRQSHDDLAPVVEELARACQQRAQPRKSLAMHIRNASGVIPASVLHEISERVVELLDRRAPIAPAPVRAVSGAWVDISEAARVLGLQRATLTERLKAAEYRYLYGWPYWDGHQWWFSTSALDPSGRAEFLARLPEREPDAHVAMLPPWCSRQAGTVAAPDPGTSAA